MSVAKRGGKVAKDARDSYEKETKKSAISSKNALNYKYIDNIHKLNDSKLVILPGTHYCYLENLGRVVSILENFL